MAQLLRGAHKCADEIDILGAMRCVETRGPAVAPQPLVRAAKVKKEVNLPLAVGVVLAATPPTGRGQRVSCQRTRCGWLE